MNDIENFFDDVASSWDERENCPSETKLSLLNETGIKKGDLVLDVACGTGVVTGLIHSLTDNKVIGIDLSSKMIELAKRKYASSDWAEFMHLDLFDLNEVNKFDAIIIYNAYPHFMDPERLANKCHKLLKEGGTLAILHSLSRKELDSHHSGRAKPISRSLGEPENEAAYFSNFESVKAKEDDKSFVLVLKKAK